MALIIVRALFVLVAAGLAVSLLGPMPDQSAFSGEPIRIFGGIMLLAVLLVCRC